MPANKLWIPLSFVVGLLIGGVGSHWSGGDPGCNDYLYINPDHACGAPPVIRKTSYAELTARVQDIIAKDQAAGGLHVATVYFRDLRGGPVWGINESINFAPASLLKLPLVMALFSLNETMPGLLDTEIEFRRARLDQFEKLKQSDVPAVKLEEGKRYTVAEFARNAIVFSDNLSYYTLVDYLSNVVPDGRAHILRTFQELGVINPRNINEEVVTARVYAALFRLLYNVSYLDADASDLLLGWLAESYFGAGLVAGLPKGTVVANKFGERTMPDGSQHLHDCGVIYFPDNPYLLCVMTKGRDQQELGRLIATISRMVWEELESRRR
ncbi:MAG TPA: serine hydrolase [Candidatus Limnocylindrales bacterium]|nr:serine hydrolase [Candidatus Limnocylindrales bacterium]